jgi:hypothetical protein
VIGNADLMRTLSPDTVQLYIAANVRRLRHKRGLTQQALADAADIEYHRWSCGDRDQLDEAMGL